MLLTISTTHQPATDLGYILHKHPDRIQQFQFTYGTAHVFYPEATNARCTIALVADINPLKLTRRGASPQTPQQALQDYVNDRPYAATSHLTTAMADVFSTAMSGRCNEKPHLPDTPIPLEITIASVVCRHSDDLIHRFFEPLGYQVEAQPIPMDEQFPEWGDSRYYNVTLKAEKTVQEILRHLYIIIPVLDNNKHYQIGKDEVDKVLRISQGWIEHHPEREIILRRALGHRHHLVNQANAAVDQAIADQQAEEAHDEEDDDQDQQADSTPADTDQPATEPTEADIEKTLRLHDHRIQAVIEAVTSSGASSVADLGCGEGQLIQHLIDIPNLKKIAGTDVSPFALRNASRKLRLRSMEPDQRSRLDLFQSSLIYRDQRLHGFDAAVAMEVIEHIDPPKLSAFAQVVLGNAKPGTLVVTTPNYEYNQLFDTIRSSGLRHRDHRFEWTRQEFQDWCDQKAEQYDYSIQYRGIGEPHPQHGHPTQMAVFTRQDPSQQLSTATN